MPSFSLHVYCNADNSLRQTTAKNLADPSRHVELDVDIGADAKDWSAIQATEKLKPVEADLRRMEEMVAEIVNEMDYLRSREQKLRDTNESTYGRCCCRRLRLDGARESIGAQDPTLSSQPKRLWDGKAFQGALMVVVRGKYDG